MTARPCGTGARRPASLLFRTGSAAAIALAAVLGASGAAGSDAPAPPAAQVAAPTSAAPTAPAGMRLLEKLRVPLRDGESIAVDVFLPAGAGRYPVILEMTPYGRGPDGLNYRKAAPYWVSRGYAFALADARGLGDSTGTFAFMRDGPDGYDLVEWLARQSWSTGAVAMLGSSYSGTNQWRVARERPPSLKCITPASVYNDPYMSTPYPGGAFLSRWAITWPALLSNAGVARSRPDFDALVTHRPLATLDEAVHGRPLALFREVLAHPTLDGFWRDTLVASEDFARIGIPTLAFTGFFDELSGETLASFRAAQARSPAGRQQWVVVGPWEHANVVDGGFDYRQDFRPNRELRGLGLPDEGFLDTRDIYGRFFDWCLRGGPEFRQAPVRVYVTGSDRWLDLPTYPPAASMLALHLDSRRGANGLGGDGRLTRHVPRRGRDEYRFDPRAPGRIDTGVTDLRTEIDREDVLVYVTEPLDESLTVLGDVRVVLHAATDGRDTDWFVRIEDVAPDGVAVRLGPMPFLAMRARYREGFAREVPVEPGRAYEYVLDGGAFAHTFRRGHRVRLSLSSSAYPWVHPNPNTGAPIATETETRVATQTVHYGRARPSRLLLPVVPTP